MSKFGTIGHRLYTGEVSYDFIGHRRRWYIVSAILIGASILALLVRGLDFGIEFKGGADFKAATTVTAQTVDSMKDALRNSGVPDLDDATVNTIGNNQVRVQTRTLDPTEEVPKVRAAIAKEVGIPSDQVAYSLIGASWGGQITERALIALGVFLALVALVIGIYFRDAKMSAAALIALVHDLILTIGIYALVGFTVTPATLIGVLTILGYSLYDTVVVFDKVRENVRDLRSSTARTYSEAANLAVNQVLVRSINTTIIGVLPVVALLFAGAVILGEGPLKDLALALFVGMVSGAYSSIFIATPLLAQMKEREPDMKKLAARVRARRAKEAQKERVATTPASTPTSPEVVGTNAAEEISEPSNAELEQAGSLAGNGAKRVSSVEMTVKSDVRSHREGAPREAAPREAAHREGAAKRPQPQNKPRSQRKK
ncbi:MAG TPA: protein translocase subunit SecF [Propionibacteriaceae bacterium]|jgi:preprotein translocase subunit SecF|nr:protein translocase subunit SecF [Propionibacteriaceae bacterium]